MAALSAIRPDKLCSFQSRLIAGLGKSIADPVENGAASAQHLDDKNLPEGCLMPGIAEKPAGFSSGKARPLFRHMPASEHIPSKV